MSKPIEETQATAPLPPTSEPAPWHAKYPEPRSKAASISKEEVARILAMEGNSASLAMVLVDLRRNDHEGGTIRGSINLPAQSLYDSFPTLYNVLSAANVKRVIWYCGSSGGRGTRASGWFADFLDEKKDNQMHSLVLTGGIKGWVAGGEEFTTLMDGYDASFWNRS